MNYKIRITAENQAIVKRIAYENGMNPHDFKFDSPNPIYHIKNSRFTFYPQDPKNTNDYTELTTDQFIELFDKKESLVGRWFQALEDNGNYSQVIKNNFYQICNETDNVIHFKVPHYGYGSLVFGIEKQYEDEYFKLMPKEFQPTEETDFKSKVIELIEKRIEDNNYWIDKNIIDKNYSYAHARQSIKADLKDLLKQIKQL